MYQSPPKAGDEFIQLDWDESSWSLDVGRGIFPDQNSRNPPFSNVGQIAPILKEAKVEYAKLQ
jgi:hypothetical protein